MRVLAVSDIHGSHDTYRWISTLLEQENVQALVLAGDLLGQAEGFDTIEAAQQADASKITAILSPVSVPILYVMGNDDEVELDPRHGNFVSLHGKRVDVPDFNFVGYQYTLPFMGGINERPEEDIAADLSRLEALMDEHTVLVTHSPVEGILDTTQLGPAGSPSLKEVIERRHVRAHIHGHIHKCFGRQDRHFNVACGGAKKAFIIDLSSMTHEILTG